MKPWLCWEMNLIRLKVLALFWTLFFKVHCITVLYLKLIEMSSHGSYTFRIRYLIWVRSREKSLRRFQKPNDALVTSFLLSLSRKNFSHWNVFEITQNFPVSSQTQSISVCVKTASLQKNCWKKAPKIPKTEVKIEMWLNYHTRDHPVENVSANRSRLKGNRSLLGEKLKISNNDH